MTINIQENNIRDIVFMSESKSLIDIHKQIRLEINNDTIKFKNLYKNHCIINLLKVENQIGNFSFTCAASDIQNIFTAIESDTSFSFDMQYQNELNILNGQSRFTIPIEFEDDFPELDENMEGLKLILDLYQYYDEIKSILIKNSHNNLPDYIVIRILNNQLYILNTDNRRIHTIIIDNPSELPSLLLCIPSYLIDIIGKYKLSLSLQNNRYILHNEKTFIILALHQVENEFRKAFQFLSYLGQKEFLNSFQVNKRLFMEEVKKHSVFSKNITFHIKPNDVIIYSKHDNNSKNDIKTISHAFDIHFQEHQSFTIDTKYLMDFIKAHASNNIEIFIPNKNLIYSKNNVCVTLRM